MLNVRKCRTVNETFKVIHINIMQPAIMTSDQKRFYSRKAPHKNILIKTYKHKK